MGAIGNKDNNGNFHFFTGVSIPEGLQMDLLWENSTNQTGTYSFTLSHPYTDYKYIEIIYKTRDATNVTNATTGRIKTSDISLNNVCALEGTYGYNGYSTIEFTSETVLTKNTYQYSKAWGTAVTTQYTQAFGNPIYVYGIK